MVYPNENTKWLIISISVNVDVSDGRAKIVIMMAQHHRLSCYIDLLQNSGCCWLCVRRQDIPEMKPQEREKRVLLLHLLPRNYYFYFFISVYQSKKYYIYIFRITLWVSETFVVCISPNLPIKLFFISIHFCKIPSFLIPVQHTFV